MSLEAPTPLLAEESAPTTRCRILATAAGYFREIGYQKTTVADIARTLKMSPANVYRFFDSKKAINEAVLERLIGEIEALVSEIAARPGLTATERLVAAIDLLHRDCTRRCEEFPRLHEMVEAAMGESWEVCRHHIARITAGSSASSARAWSGASSRLPTRRKRPPASMPASSATRIRCWSGRPPCSRCRPSRP